MWVKLRDLPIRKKNSYKISCVKLSEALLHRLEVAGWIWKECAETVELQYMQKFSQTNITVSYLT